MSNFSLIIGRISWHVLVGMALVVVVNSFAIRFLSFCNNQPNFFVCLCLNGWLWIHFEPGKFALAQNIKSRQEDW